MSSSKNESQTKESSSDEEQENEYYGMNKLMGNLAPELRAWISHSIFKWGKWKFWRWNF